MADSTERDPPDPETADVSAIGGTPTTEAATTVDAAQDDAGPDAVQLATLADEGDPLLADDAQGATEAASNVEATPDDASAEAEQLATLADDGDPLLADDGQESAAENAPAENTSAESALARDPASALVAGLESIEAGDDFRRPAAEVKSIVEALIFASPDPLTPKALLKLLDNEPKEDVLAALEELKQDYERPGGLQLVEVAGGFQIVTRADLNEWVRRLFHERSTQKLSVQALESLAVIAYRQPITAIEITEIRGVNTSGVLNTLLERHLIKIVGRKQVVGRPFMYATTKEFLIRFGLKDLSDLPKVEDMAESLGIESRLLIEQTPAEEQLPLSEPDADELSDDTVDGADAADSDTSEPEGDDETEPSER